MVHVIHVARLGPYPANAYRMSPRIEIYNITRSVEGNGIKLEVWGEMKIGAGEFVFARELLLNTLEVLLLTPEIPRQGWTGVGYIANKRIYNKGQLDNYASIDIYDDASTWLCPGVGPEDGSIWVNFQAKGE